MNGDVCGTYNKNSQIKFKTTMLKPSLCDYSDFYILVKGCSSKKYRQTNKQETLKNWAPFSYCISKINFTEIDNGRNLDVLMLYNLIEYYNIQVKGSGRLWYHKHNPNDNVKDPETLNSRQK